MKQYINKNELAAEIEKCYNECLQRAKITDSDYWNAKADAYRNVLVILNDTLEVKEEVNLEKEFEDFVVDDPVIGNLVNFNAAKIIAKHFFELGLKIKKC